MLNRTTLLVATFAASMVTSLAFADAAERMAYTPQGFEAAQKAGKPILVEITAPWCPTCKAQRPILSQLFADPKYKNLAVFDVDFDSQKAAVKGFKAQMQSTLIAFHGDQEVARSVGDTKADSIRALVEKSI